MSDFLLSSRGACDEGSWPKTQDSSLEALTLWTKWVEVGLMSGMSKNDSDWKHSTTRLPFQWNCSKSKILAISIVWHRLDDALASDSSTSSEWQVGHSEELQRRRMTRTKILRRKLLWMTGLMAHPENRWVQAGWHIGQIRWQIEKNNFKWALWLVNIWYNITVWMLIGLGPRV